MFNFIGNYEFVYLEKIKIKLKKNVLDVFQIKLFFKKFIKLFFLFPRYKFHHVIRIDKQKVIVHKSTLELSAKLS